MKKHGNFYDQPPTSNHNHYELGRGTCNPFNKVDHDNGAWFL